LAKDRIIAVAQKHIEPGIEKYGGKIDAHLQSLINNAGLAYSAYILRDGRVMLVMPHNISALLYPDKETLLEVLQLEG